MLLSYRLFFGRVNEEREHAKCGDACAKNKQRDDATQISHKTDKTTAKYTAHATCPQESAPTTLIGFLGEDLVPLLLPAACELQQQRCVKLAESGGHVDRVHLQPMVH